MSEEERQERENELTKKLSLVETTHPLFFTGNGEITMSITLECRKTKSEMEIGYGNFFFLRAKVAELFDKNVWQQYMKIMEIPYGDDRKQALEKWDEDMDRILQASEMPSGVKDFLFQSDCAGNISRSACMALYERIHNYDNNIAYGFRIVKDSFGNLIRQELGFQDFVELIKECIDTNCDLLWS